jgi:hypothetical protein
MAPLVVKGRCWSALWRRARRARLVGGARCHRQDPMAGLRHGADKDVLIAPDSLVLPFRITARTSASRPGRPTPGRLEEERCEMVAYDPDLNLIYSGTGNPGPWNQSGRATANGPRRCSHAIPIPAPPNGRYSIARMTARLRRDQRAYLVDMTVDGNPRRCCCIWPQRSSLRGGPREARSSQPNHTAVNSVLSIDLKTGRPPSEPDKLTRSALRTRHLPTASGLRDWIRRRFRVDRPDVYTS